MEAFCASGGGEGGATVPVFWSIADVDLLTFEDGTGRIQMNAKGGGVVNNFCVDQFVVKGIIGVAAVAAVRVARIEAEPVRGGNATWFGVQAPKIASGRVREREILVIGEADASVSADGGLGLGGAFHMLKREVVAGK